MREDQNCYTDQRCDYPERSHGAFSHRLTPLTRVYFFRVGRRPPVDAINMRRVGRSAGRSSEVREWERSTHSLGPFAKRPWAAPRIEEAR
jgi:hypothetical protein